MSILDEDIVGRDEELARIGTLVTSARDGPAALVIQGDPGIGKTTLWRQGVRLFEDSGFRVLRTTPSASETSLPLSALSDLLEPVVDEVRNDLPPPQRRALDVAVALAESPDPSASDGRVLRAATRSVFRALARHGPVALAAERASDLRGPA